MTAPSDHAYASAALISAWVFGFERAKTTGRRDALTLTSALMIACGRCEWERAELPYGGAKVGKATVPLVRRPLKAPLAHLVEAAWIAPHRADEAARLDGLNDLKQIGRTAKRKRARSRGRLLLVVAKVAFAVGSDPEQLHEAHRNST